MTKFFLVRIIISLYEQKLWKEGVRSGRTFRERPFGVSASETRNGSSLFDRKVSFAVEMKYIAAYVGVNDFE